MTTAFLSKYIKGATSFSGQLARGTTPVDQDAFRINDNVLKDLIAKDFKGKRPNDIFLKDPTPFGNLFTKNKWTPLTTTLQPFNFKLLSQQQKKTVLWSDSFTNNSSNPTNWSIFRNNTVTSTAISNWVLENSFGSDVSATSEVHIEIAEASRTVRSNFRHTWGQHQSTHVTSGTSTSFQVVVLPGETRTATLYSVQGIYKFRVLYEALLSGGVLAHYKPAVNGQQFFYLPIATLLSKAGISSKLKVSHQIETSENIQQYLKVI